MQDTGLLMAMLEEDSAYNILNGDMGIYKGAVYENIIADAFSKNQMPLYYFRKDSGLEIDFVTVVDSKTTIIEVKARNGNSKSANEVLNNNKFNADQLIKLGEYNIGINDNKVTIPYYLAFLVC